MSSDFNQFDDPGLKASVQRAFAHERAPAELRQRIVGMLSAPEPLADHPPLKLPAQSPPAARPFIWSFTAARLAVAALLLVGIATALLVYRNTRPTPPPSINEATLAAMVQTHDECCHHEHRDERLPQESFAALGKAIADELNEPILSADLSKDGWSFEGAAICSVRNKRAAHMIFARGEQRLSVFSVPASTCGSVKEGSSYRGRIRDHVVVGTTRKGGVHCIVAHCPGNTIKLEEVADLLERHQGEIVASADPVNPALPR
jgi:hypothetical protein